MPRKQRSALPLLQKRWLSVFRRKAFILRRLSRRRRLGRSCLVSARNLRSSSHFSGRYRSWRRLSCPEPRPGSWRGPLFLGGPLRALCACASTPWGPGAPLACATHVGHGRVPLTSVARLFRAFLRVFSVPDFAPPLLLHPLPCYDFPSITPSLRQGIRSPRRSLSPPAQARPHVRASLPRRPSPRHLCGTSAPWGPGAPSACVPHV